MSRTFVVVVAGITVIAGIGAAASYAFLRLDREPPRRAEQPPAPKGPSPVGQTVFLTVREPPAGDVASFPPQHLHRELARQAFLIAARDDIGLSTRDSLLREDFPENPVGESLPFELFCRVTVATKNQDMFYALSRPGWDDTELWHSKNNLDLDDAHSLITLVEQADGRWCGEFKDILTGLGAKATVRPHRASGEVPQGTEAMLWSWNEISVLGGLRRVHAEIREQGESPELLAALAVGYANLATLTEYQYSAAYKAYYARALLYAQRLLRETDGSAWALWHRAYVRMQVGTHTFAADDIAAARKKSASGKSGGGPARPLPFFADVLEAFGQGHVAQMSKVATTPDAHRLAGYLSILALLNSNLYDLNIRVVKEFLADCPDFTRGYDALVASHELAAAHEGAYASWARTAAFLRKRVPEVPGVAKPLATQIGDAEISGEPAPEIAFRTNLVAGLEQAGQPGVDAGEPSLSALGHLIEEIDFAQVIRRLELENQMYGVPTDETVATLAPLVARHPYAAYLAAFRQSKTVKEAGVATLEKKIAPVELTFKQRAILKWMRNVTHSEPAAKWYLDSMKHGDVIFSDLIRDINMGMAGAEDDQKNGSYTWMMSKVSNKLPIVVALTIQRDWAHTEREADRLEREYAEEPLVLSALGWRYYGLKRYHDAERCARRLVEVHKGYPSYRLLANVYKALGDDARWQQTLEQSLALPSAGLEQAQVQNDIALSLLDRKRVKEAVVYADAAAESYSGWSMLTAARCHELLGDWDRSEDLIRRCAVRYDSLLEVWMLWCHRTGHGDIKAADGFARQKFEALENSLDWSQQDEFAGYFLLTNDLPQAFSRFRRVFDSHAEPYAGFHAALVADQLGRAADCDAILAKVIQRPPRKTKEWEDEPYQKLAPHFRELLPPRSAPRLNFAEVDKILAAARSKGFHAAQLPCFVGVFLKNRGDLEGAKKYLIRAAQSKDWQKFNNALACQLLREMKVAVPPANDLPTIEPPPPAMPRHKADDALRRRSAAGTRQMR